MPTTLTQTDLFNAALALPQETRVELAERLMASLGKPKKIWNIDEPNLGAELDRRVDELDSGKAQAIGWTAVKQEIRDMLQQRRGA